LKLDI